MSYWAINERGISETNGILACLQLYSLSGKALQNQISRNPNAVIYWSKSVWSLWYLVGWSAVPLLRGLSIIFDFDIWGGVLYSDLDLSLT